jgi:DNA-binding protein Fis
MSGYQTSIERAAYEMTARLCQGDTKLTRSVLLDFAEKGIIRAALEHTQGDQSSAAKLLGVSCQTLRKRIALHELQYHGKLEGVAL